MYKKLIWKWRNKKNSIIMYCKKKYFFCFYFFLLLFFLSIDQILKIYINRIFFNKNRFCLIYFFDINFIFNGKLTFNFLVSRIFFFNIIFVIFSILISFVMIYLYIYFHCRYRTLLFNLNLFIGCLFGNFIDKLTQKNVLDFILFYYNNFNYVSFNISDIGMLISIILVISKEVICVKNIKIFL